jgi:hypothetical protein
MWKNLCLMSSVIFPDSLWFSCRFFWLTNVPTFPLLGTPRPLRYLWKAWLLRKKQDSSTCSERVISSERLTFFSGSNDYYCDCLQIKCFKILGGGEGGGGEGTILEKRESLILAKENNPWREGIQQKKLHKSLKTILIITSDKISSVYQTFL